MSARETDRKRADAGSRPRHRWAALDAEPGTAPGAGVQVPLFEVPDREIGTGEFRGLEFVHVRARQVINEVPASSPVPFRFTINAYRGCSHACTYCFARPTHAYLDLDPATDFDRVIVVKVNAVERVRAELAPKRWNGESIAMGTNTDPYQRAEGKYRLTRGIVEVLGEARNPFSILTKGTLILRDLDVLSNAARRTSVETCFSIGTLDEEVWRATEPGTPHPMRRVEAVARLNDAGVSCGVLLAPVLPGLSDRRDQLDAVVRACLDAGARSISPVMLHLRPGVREHYLDWLTRHRPDLLAAHHERYRRAYAPNAERDALSQTVRELVAAHRRRARLRSPVRLSSRYDRAGAMSGPDPAAASEAGGRRARKRAATSGRPHPRASGTGRLASPSGRARAGPDQPSLPT